MFMEFIAGGAPLFRPCIRTVIFIYYLEYTCLKTIVYLSYFGFSLEGLAFRLVIIFPQSHRTIVGPMSLRQMGPKNDSTSSNNHELPSLQAFAIA